MADPHAPKATRQGLTHGVGLLLVVTFAYTLAYTGADIGRSAAQQPPPAVAAGAAGEPAASAAVMRQLDLSGRRGTFRPITIGTAVDQEVSGRANGRIDASGLGEGCSGYIAAQPDHVMTLRADLEALRLSSQGEAPTVLVVRTPDGRFLCASAPRRHGRRAVAATTLDQGPWPRGRYLVWVATVDHATTTSYRLAITAPAAAAP